MSGDGNGHVRVGNGNGHVRVGAGRDDAGSGDRPGGSGGPGGPGGDRPVGGHLDDDGRMPPWLRPGPAALIALGLAVVAAFGWGTATWRVSEGAVVPCGSFTPNPAVWHAPVNVDADAGRTDPRAVSWAAALRETRGTLACVAVEGRTPADLEVLLGAPTDTSQTDRGDVPGLRGDEQAWSFTRGVPGGRETTAIVVRFADGGAGRAVSIRAFGGGR